jgi:YidC/Oxa1 family membrane protein insertase
MLVFANILQPLIDFFEAILKFFHDNVGLSWGASIIAMTVLVRATLLPLTVKQFKSMQNLARHQPELKRLQDKYKGDRERLNQEMMKFYRENQVNPFASCLPLLAQIPVFISLFYMLRKDLRHDVCPVKNPPSVLNPAPCGSTGDSKFFFIPDITNAATGKVLIVLLVLYVSSQLLSSLLSMTQADKTQRMIFLALPFFFVPFVIGFPAGLLVYWITTNLWTIVQQWFIRRRIGPLRPPGSEPGPGFGDLFKQAREGAGGSSSGDSGNGGKSADRPKGRTTAAPPPPPRKKKKRSGRRR